MWRKLFATIISLLLVILTVILIWIGVLERRVLNPEFYESLLLESNLYEIVVEWQWQALGQGLPSGVKPILQTIGFDKFNQAIREVAPPEFLYQQIGPAVGSLREWLNSNKEPEDLQIKFELGDLKKRLPVVAHNLIKEVVAGLPVCNTGELRQLLTGDTVWCRPAFLSSITFARQLETGLSFSQILEKIPASVSWQEFINQPGGQTLRHNLLEFRQNYQEAKQLVKYVWLGLLVLWLLLVFLLSPWWRLLVEWLGAVAVLIGGIQLTIYASLPWLAAFIWQQTAAGWPAASRLDADRLEGTVATVTRGLNTGLLNLSVIFIIAGVVIWLAAHLIRKKNLD